MEIWFKVIEKSWKSHGNPLVKMCMNPESSARAQQEQTAIKIFCPNNLLTYSFISYHGTYPTASLQSASTMMPSDRNISIQLISFKLAL